jgi:hypothetical protein
MKKVDLAGWAAIAEIIGTVAVVASLLFVGLSVQQNTTAFRAENDNVMYQLTDSWWQEFIVTPELNLLYDKQSRGESLSFTETEMVLSHSTRLLNNWELAFARYDDGLMPSKQWDMWHRSHSEMLDYYVTREYWNSNRSTFATDFASYVDAIFEAD